MNLLKKVTYANAGVDREIRLEAKKSLKLLKKTFRFNPYGEPIQLPYGNIFPLNNRYLDLVIEGVGTKVLLAQVTGRHDTIGVDGVAMAVNDILRSGATPLAIVDNIHAQTSDPLLVKEWMKGIIRGAEESQCAIVGGEIGDVSDIIQGVKNGVGFDLVISCVGEVTKDQIIFGDNIEPGNIVIGMKSSGLHSNGITLARKILFKVWGGKYDLYAVPDNLDRELATVVLEPTKIYVKPFLEITKRFEVKGAVHITGDAYLKFNRLMESSKGIGFHLHNFKPQPIFQVIQEAANDYGGIEFSEMFKTFNMGWGFAIVVDETAKEGVLDLLERFRVEAEPIGEVTSQRSIVVEYGERKIALS